MLILYVNGVKKQLYFVESKELKGLGMSIKKY